MFMPVGTAFTLVRRRPLAAGEACRQDSMSRTLPPPRREPTTIYATAQASQLSSLAGSELVQILRRVHDWTRWDYWS